MIAKNEERDIAAALASVRPVCGEMIVVDTGSDDSTPDIAAAMGARVSRIEWKDDFAAARNHAMNMASGDWILSLDADETVSEKDHGTILAECSDESAGAYTVLTRNYLKGQYPVGWMPNPGDYDEERGDGWIESWKIRLFRNRPGVGWVGAVHELIEPTVDRTGGRFDRSKWVVHHYGKLDKRRTGAKTERYCEIARKKIVESGGSPAAIREFAVEALGLGKYEESIAALDVYLRNFELKGRQVAEAFLNIGYAYSRLSNPLWAFACTAAAVNVDPDMQEAWLNHATSFLAFGHLARAEEILTECGRRFPEYVPARRLLDRVREDINAHPKIG